MCTDHHCTNEYITRLRLNQLDLWMHDIDHHTKETRDSHASVLRNHADHIRRINDKLNEFETIIQIQNQKIEQLERKKEELEENYKTRLEHLHNGYRFFFAILRKKIEKNEKRLEIVEKRTIQNNNWFVKGTKRSLNLMIPSNKKQKIENIVETIQVDSD